MSYPTVNFQPTSAFAGLQPLSATSSTQMHPIGTIIRAVDFTYGEGEFIYLLGVASTAAGDLVCFNSSTGQTVRAVHSGSTSKGAAAIAMAANTAGLYGWYQISGSGPVNAATVAANASVYLTSTAGQIDDAAVTGDLIDGLTTQAADSGGFATCHIDRPNVSGITGSGGAIAAAQMPALTGDVTTSAGAVATTIAANAVTNAKMATMAAKTIKGNNTASTAAAADLSLFQVRDILLSQTNALTPTNGGTAAIDASLGLLNTVTYGSSVASATITSPIGSTTANTVIEIRIINSSGSTITTTWDSTGSGGSLGYQLAGSWTDPANGKNRSISFRYNNSTGKWQERWRTTADVTN